MADYFYDPLAPIGGSGTSQSSPFNTLGASVPSGAHRFMLRAGRRFRETFMFPSTSNGSILMPYGEGPLPLIDCENTRLSGVNLNQRVGCEVTGIEVQNQNAIAPDGGIRVSGSGNYVHHCRFKGNQNAIHLSNTSGHRIEWNYIDVGNPLTPTDAYAVRLSGSACTNNLVRYNEVTSSLVPVGEVGTIFMASLFFFGVGAGNRMDYNWVHDIRADGPSLRNGTTGCTMIGNLVCGARILDAMAVEGSNGNIIRNNTAINSGDVPGHFGPGLKMGNEFGAAPPSDLNSVENNLLVSLGSVNNCMNLTTIGTGNTFRGNRLWRPNGGNIVNLNTGSGTSALTFAAWQAAGFSTGDTFGNPMADPRSWQPLPGSPLLSGGVDLLFVRDRLGRQGRRFVGCHVPAPFRSVPAFV